MPANRAAEPVEGAGQYLRPTTIADVQASAALIREEVFGPMLAFVPFDHPHEALRLANDSPFGLAASLWTDDLRAAMRMVSDIDSVTGRLGGSGPSPDAALTGWLCHLLH